MSKVKASQDVVIAAPLSLAGSAERLWKVTRASAWLIPVAVLLIIIAWAVVLAWYCVFGIWLLPYRIIRRGQRKRRVAMLRHAEMLSRLPRYR